MLLLSADPKAAIVRERLAAHRAHGELVISAVNWCEALSTAQRKAGTWATVRSAAVLRRVPISVVDADAVMAAHAAEMKTRYRLGLGDCFAAGLALALRAPLLTGDADFLPLAEHGLKIDWVGSEGR